MLATYHQTWPDARHTFKSLAMRNGTFYLNNTGHRWVVYDNGRKPQFYVRDEDGNFHLRTIQFVEAFGNFAAYHFSWQGYKVSALPEDIETHEGLPIVNTKHLAWPKCQLKQVPEVETYKLPTHWASALINGDYSGLSDEEEAEINEWLDRVQPGHCSGCSDDAEFRHSYDAPGLACDCHDYTFITYKLVRA